MNFVKQLVNIKVALQVIGGIEEEFVFGPRLDNLAGTFTALEGLVQSLQDPASLQADTNVRSVCTFLPNCFMCICLHFTGHPISLTFCAGCAL